MKVCLDDAGGWPLHGISQLFEYFADVASMIVLTKFLSNDVADRR
jgi:hypothetical protein